tara:strand:+ start:647 stop:955 length:309 start_codon:yes stop_codon:yes gene_type:complete
MYEHQLYEIKSELLFLESKLEEIEKFFVYNPFVHTPRDQNEVDKKIIDLCDGGERSVAYMYYYMGHNLAVKQIQDKTGIRSSTGLKERIKAMLKLLKEVSSE